MGRELSGQFVEHFRVRRRVVAAKVVDWLDEPAPASAGAPGTPGGQTANPGAPAAPGMLPVDDTSPLAPTAVTVKDRFGNTGTHAF